VPLAAEIVGMVVKLDNADRFDVVDAIGSCVGGCLRRGTDPQSDSASLQRNALMAEAR
jgi:hypothetical protein